MLNSIYSAFTQNKELLSKRSCEMFPHKVSENLESELLEGDFYVSYNFYMINIYEQELFFFLQTPGIYCCKSLNKKQTSSINKAILL